MAREALGSGMRARSLRREACPVNPVFGSFAGISRGSWYPAKRLREADSALRPEFPAARGRQVRRLHRSVSGRSARIQRRCSPVQRRIPRHRRRAALAGGPRRSSRRRAGGHRGANRTPRARPPAPSGPARSWARRAGRSGPRGGYSVQVLPQSRQTHMRAQRCGSPCQHSSFVFRERLVGQVMHSQNRWTFVLGHSLFSCRRLAMAR
jgi:hypothetical protein